MKITIITPTFNSAKTIERNADSVLNQTYTNYEHVIVDNFSTDKTIDKVRKVYEDSGSTEKLKIIREKDTGISEAFNKGIESAKGDVIGILNSDDNFYDNNVLAKVDDSFKDENILFVHGNIFFEDTTYGSNIRNPLLCHITNAMPYNHPTMFFREEVYRIYGGFNQSYKYAMDFEFICRLTKSIKNFESKGRYITGSPLVTMFAGGVSWSNELNSIEETKKALMQHDEWNFNAYKYYFYRKARTKFKLILSQIGMQGIVVKWRKQKWGN